MEINTALIWKKQPEEVFEKGKYSRIHEWRFDGGESILVSSSPIIVPIPYSDENLMDPEEAFVTSIGSCHMLFFLSIASKKGVVVEKYEDFPKGYLGIQSSHRVIEKIILNPKVEYQGKSVGVEQEKELHKEAHLRCFLANSVKTKIEINL